MNTISHPRTSSLSADEREVIVTYNDAERLWRVYSDSLTMRGAVLRLARQIGAEVHRVGGHGVEFEVPGDALRLTAKRRHGGRASNLTRPRLDRAAEGKVAILNGPLAEA